VLGVSKIELETKWSKAELMLDAGVEMISPDITWWKRFVKHQERGRRKFRSKLSTWKS
jgi:hypothetical protein